MLWDALHRYALRSHGVKYKLVQNGTKLVANYIVQIHADDQAGSIGYTYIVFLFDQMIHNKERGVIFSNKEKGCTKNETHIYVLGGGTACWHSARSSRS